MACNANKAPFLRSLTKRGFASLQARPLGKPAAVNTSVLPNKIVVATADSTLPVSRVSIVFRAGARNESYENQGASHLLRIAAGLSTVHRTGFSITRNIQQTGANLYASSDREIVAYTLEATEDKISSALNYLQDVVQPAFKPWEMADSLPRIRIQAAGVSPQVQAVEFLHRAAFRNGLGNSVYIPKYQVGKISSEDMLHYFTNNCTTNRCAVVGVGIDHTMLSGFAQNLELPTGEGKTGSPFYHGGDERKDTAGHVAHVAVAGLGGALNNQKEALAFGILQYASGAAAATKRGNINGSLGEAVSNAIGGECPVSFTALNACYSDAGLFGFIISTDARHVGRAVESAARALKSACVEEEQVNRGKALLKSAILDTYCTESLLLTEMSLQAAITQKVHSVEAILGVIDGITTEDVQEAAKKAGSSKLSVGAVGNLSHAPYSSDLN